MSAVKWGNIVEAAENNDMDAIKYFVEEKHVDTTVCNEDDQTAAHIALKNNNLPLLKYLVNNNPSLVTPTDMRARNILIQAVDQGALDAIKFLIEERDEDVSSEHNLFYSNTAVHMAALRGQFEILRYFLDDREIDVNIRSDFGETPLFLAAEKANMPMVKYLIEKKKARISITDKNNDNVLYISARKGDLNVPRYLLDEQRRRIDLDHRDYFGETILHRAVKFSHLPFIEYLVEEKGVNVNLPDDDGKTPLHHAAENGNVTIVEYLCDNGAFTYVRNDYNQTALEAAKDPQTVEYLKKVTKNAPRRHRSVPGSSFEFHGWREEIRVGKVTFFSSNSVNALADHNGDVLGNSVQLESVLMFIGACLRYSTVVPYLSSLSPSESLRSRMDPIAVDAVEAGFDVES